jgi:hypothetical protein
VLLPVRDDLSIDESGLRSHSGTLKRWRDYRRLRSMRIRPRWPHVQPTSSAACWGSQAKGSAIGVSADPRHMAVGSLETAPSQAGAGGRIIGVSGIAAGAFGQTADMTIAHFEAIASASDLSLNVFRYPLATGQGYPVATVIRCSDEIRCICAVKDWTPGAPQHDAQVRPLQSPGHRSTCCQPTMSRADLLRSIPALSDLCRDLRQRAPVEGDTMAVPCRRYRHTLFEGKRLLDIAVEPESVGLEIGAV